MDNSINEMINLPNGDVLLFDECLYNLCNTRDIDVYLDLLFALRDKYLIILGVKDTPGIINDEMLKKIKKIGFDNCPNKPWHMYIGVNYKGNKIFDNASDKQFEPVFFDGDVYGNKLNIISKAWKNGNLSVIEINEVDYSFNGRGLNFVIYDCDSSAIIDSSVYDSRMPNPEFYHKNTQIDDEYFKQHFYLKKPIEPWKDALGKKYFSNEKLKTQEIVNGVIEPLKEINGEDMGGVCDENYRFICGHANYPQNAQKLQRCINNCYKPECNELEISDETVVFGGVIFDHPGHLILESVAERLWWIVNNPNTTLKIAIIVKWHKNAGFFREFMDVLGVSSDRIIIVKKPTKFAKIIIPDACEMMYWDNIPYIFTKEYFEFFSHLKKQLQPAKYKKVYLSKSKTSKGNIVGEEYFINFYEKRGFKIIYPEDYTISEKIEIMLGADEIVSLAGTNMYYTIFCNPTTKITMLTRTNNAPCFSLSCGTISTVNNMENFYVVNVDMGFLHKDFAWGVSLMGVTEEFKSYVRDMFNEDIEITPKEYLANNLYDYLSYCSEYYSSNPRYFRTIKNQKMLTVLQMISEVFLEKEFDTTNLDITTDEDNLRSQVKQLTTDLTASKSRAAELEKTDVYKAAKLLETTNVKLESQVAELCSALQNMQNLQIKIDELSGKNDELMGKNVELTNINAEFAINNHELKNIISELTVKKSEIEKTLIKTKHDLEIQADSYEQLHKKAYHLSEQLKTIQTENTALQSEKIQLEKQIKDYEQSKSWRLTKPLRSIACFFKRLFGKK